MAMIAPFQPVSGTIHATPAVALTLQGCAPLLIDATRQQAIATMARAIIIASGRPHSIEQALEIMHDMRFATYPARQLAVYKEWEKTKDARLKKVHCS
jgi:hypothetical protein